MKKIPFLLGVLFCALTLSGCFLNKNTQIQSNQMVQDTTENNSSTNTSSTLTSGSELPKPEAPATELRGADIHQNTSFRILRKDLQRNNQAGKDLFFSTYGKEDCYGIQNASIYSEDLFQMLISNDKARAVLKPQLYTKKYSTDLFALIKKYHEDNLDPLPSIFYLCHLNKNTDLAIGKYFYDEAKRDSVVENAKGYEMFLVSDKKLYHIREVQPLDTEQKSHDTVYPCKAHMQEKKILWSCFTGYKLAENNESKLKTYRDWSISLDGRILSLKDREEE